MKLIGFIFSINFDIDNLMDNSCFWIL